MAPPAEIAAGIWHKQFPCLLHLKNPIFIDGTLREGISLRTMFVELGHESFASTSRNFQWNAKHKGKAQKNIDPRRSIKQKSGIRLTPRAAEWLEKEIKPKLA